MKRFTLFFVCLFLSIGAVMAQQKIVSGVVISAEDNQPVIGASVVAKGFAGVGAQTDIDGKFSFTAPSAATTIVVSYMGMQSREVAITPNMRIVLQPDSKLLEEVVVTGYGNVRKSSFTGSATTISSKTMKDIPTAKLEDKLSGAIAGLNISQNSGQPGGTATLRIRGMGSINAGNEPLFVIDGIPMMNNNAAEFSYSGSGSNMLSMINSNDIESISVIKDAAAASLYGSRAANGVIVITTKRGQTGKTRFSFKADWGFSDMAINYRPVLNGEKRRELLKLGLENFILYKQGGTPEDAKAFAESKIDNYAPMPWTGSYTDWRDILFRKGFTNNYELNVTGGNDKTKFFTSLSYMGQQGITKASDFDRFTGNVNITHKDGRFGLNAKTMFALTDQNVNGEGTGFSSPIMAIAMSVSPSSYPYNKDGSYAKYFPAINGHNPLQVLDINVNNNRMTRILPSIEFTYDILPGLQFKEAVGYDYLSTQQKVWWDPRFGDGQAAQGVMQRINSEWIKTNTQSQLIFNKDFDKHNVNALVGFESEDRVYKYIYANGSKYPTYTKNEIENAGDSRASSGTEGFRMLSYLGKLDYNFDSKYFLGGSFRRDGSSRLSKDSRWGNFWSVSGSWKISSEEFMQEMKSVLDDLRLRASYGINGTLPSGNYDHMSLYKFGYNYLGKAGMRETDLGNKNLKWEKNNAFNIGLDFSLFRRVSVTFDFYNRLTTDLLMYKPISQTTGFLRELQNLGEMRNTGFELEIRSQNINKENFRWSTTFTFAHNKNKLLKYDGEQTRIKDGRIVHEVGKPYYGFNLIEYKGVDEKTGMPLYVKNTENADGTLDKSLTTNAAEAQPITLDKYPDPKLTGGIINTLNMGPVDMAFTFTYSLGGYVYDNVRWIHSDGGGFMYFGNIPDSYDVDKMWKKPGDKAELPVFMFGNQDVHSDRWLFSTNHMRLKNLTLGYTAPKSLTNKLGIESLRVYTSANNLLTFKSKGLKADPEVPIGGLVMFETPPLKTITFGVQLGF